MEVEKKKLPASVPEPSKESSKKECRIRRGDAVDAMRLLQEALPSASYSSFSDVDSEDCSTIGNTQTAAQEGSSRNSSSESDRRKRSGTKPAPLGESKAAQAVVPNPKAKEGHVPSVVLRETAKWMAMNAEMYQRGIRTTKVVNTNVGIRIQPATAIDYHQLIRIDSAFNVQFHSYQLTEETPLKVAIRGVSDEITEEEVTQNLANQEFHNASCKRMVVGTARHPIPLIFIQLAKSEDSKKIFFAYMRHECHYRVKAGQEGPVNPMPPLPVVWAWTAELPRGRGLRKMHRGASNGGMQETQGQVARNLPRHTVGKPKPRLPDSLRQHQRHVRNRKGREPGNRSPNREKRHQLQGKPKTPAAATGPKPAPKKPETAKPDKQPRLAIANNAAQDIPKARTTRTEHDASSTLALLTPLFQRINWTKLQKMATILLPLLLACRSGAEAGLVLAS
ncbi:hypothetical protein Trydic_g8101 [Trypoxylus dichotomus]